MFREVKNSPPPHPHLSSVLVILLYNLNYLQPSRGSQYILLGQTFYNHFKSLHLTYIFVENTHIMTIHNKHTHIIHENYLFVLYTRRLTQSPGLKNTATPTWPAQLPQCYTATPQLTFRKIV